MIVRYGPQLTILGYYFQDEDVRHQSPSRDQDQGLSLSATTPRPIPLGFTTTRRPFNASPRVKSNIRQNQRNRLSTPSPPVQDDRRSFVAVPPLIEDNDVVEDVTEEPIVNPFDNPPFISADGKKPRVKANLNTAKFASGNNNKPNKFEKNRKQGSKKVELDRSQFHNINFVSPRPGIQAQVPASEDSVTRFSGPEVRPDGRVPRVKSDVLAARPRPREPGLVTATRASFVSPSPTPGPRPLPSRGDIEEFDPSTQSVSPSTIRSVVAEEGIIRGSPEPIFTSSFRNRFEEVTSPAPPHVSSFRPFSADPPQFSILSATPSNVPRLPSTTRAPVSQRPASTFTLPPPPARPRPSGFPDLGPPPQPKMPAHIPPPQNRPRPRPVSRFPDLGPPPQPQLPASLPPPPSLRPRPGQPRLPTDRKRFGSRPRVKANELAQKANAGNRQQIGVGESPRNSFARAPESDTNEIVPGHIVTQSPRSRPRSRPERPSFKVRFKTLNDISTSDPCVSNPFKCPPRQSADGRKPRVKSNIKAARRNFWHPRKGRIIKKQRKQGKLNAALWNRGIIRRGRKQSLSQDVSNAIDNNIDDAPITTEDPIRSLEQIVATKEKHKSKTFEAFPAARSFQNKRLRLKQKINHRGRNAFRGGRTTISRTFNDFQTTTPTTFAETTSASSTVSLFVTNPDFTPAVTEATEATEEEEDRFQPRLSVPALPASAPTQSSPETPFTQPDMGLFVTNPRALPDHHRATNKEEGDRNLFNNPPRFSADSRRPRVKSNIMAKLSHKPRGHRQQTEERRPQPSQDTETETVTTEIPKPVLRIVPDGRSPRVKSNLLNKSTNRKHHQKNAKHKFKGSGRRKFGRSLDLSGDNNNEIGDTSEESDVDFEDTLTDNIDKPDDDYVEPEVRPDGRKPRIKSNILAKKFSNRKNRWGDKNANKKQEKGKSGFRHSKRVSGADKSFKSSDQKTPFSGPEQAIDDGSDNAITTFRPIISLEEFMSSNETFPSPSPAPPPPPSSPELSVPLPNFDESLIRGSGLEPAFSDMTNTSSRDSGPRVRVPPQSVTEIVRVSSADKNLFNSDYSYYDYYEEFINSN